LKKGIKNNLVNITKMSLMKLTKAKLIELIQEHEENKFDILKEETGMPYQTDEEWVEYIINLQTLNAERLNDVDELTRLLETQNKQLQVLKKTLDSYRNTAPR
jgi:hypothetical protein|tara:strand:- start:934 stop:1242 length:309 start_codon:yes stop_codon:yes gene_type:complete